MVKICSSNFNKLITIYITLLEYFPPAVKPQPTNHQLKFC